MNGARVLVVDDDADVRSLARTLLERGGYDVSEAADGREGLRALYRDRPDLVMLDVGMQGLDGWRTLERIREVSDVPVLMLTGREGELEKVRALKAGADDYVTKPFGRQELMARVEALLRRSAAGGARSQPAVETYADALLSIDFRQSTVTVAGRDVRLTPKEFRLLGAFTRHPNQILSQEQLIELVWGDAGSSEQVKLYVGYLRRKLREAHAGASPIETVRGFGYRFRPTPEAYWERA